MPLEKPRLSNYLKTFLTCNMYPTQIFWIDEENQVFAIELKRINSKQWTCACAALYVGWDQVNFEAGFQDRKPNPSDSTYFPAAKHRFQEALKQLHEFQPKVKGKASETRFYQFSSSDIAVDQLESSRLMGTEEFDKKELKLSLMEMLTIIVEGNRKTFYKFADSKGRIQWSDESLQNVYYVPMLPDKVTNLLVKGTELSQLPSESFSITDSNILYSEDHGDPNAIYNGDVSFSTTDLFTENGNVVATLATTEAMECKIQSDAIEVINLFPEEIGM